MPDAPRRSRAGKMAAALTWPVIMLLAALWEALFLTLVRAVTNLGVLDDASKVDLSLFSEALILSWLSSPSICSSKPSS